jgi:chromate reductase
MRILGISGSLRRDSYNTALLRHAGELFEAEGSEFELYDGLREIPPFDEDNEDDAPEAVTRLRAAVASADGVFFTTPEYNSSIPGALKNALDWVRKVLAAMGGRLVEGEVAVGHAMDRFDSVGRLDDPNLEEQVREVIRELLAEADATTRERLAA